MTAVTFPDPRRAGRDLLKGALTGRPESFAQGVTVSTKAPTGTDASRPLPWIQVRSDGRFRDATLNGRASLRIIVWHRDEGLSEDLAGLAESLLLSSSSADIRGCNPLAGPLPTTDPDTGVPMSFFTVTARLRPVNLP